MAKHYFKMTGKHPISGPDTRVLVTEDVHEFESWVEDFKECGFEDVHTSVMTDREYADFVTSEELADIFMFKGMHYIMGNTKEFGVDTIAMYDIKESKTFRQKVFDKVSELPGKYQNLSGKAAAYALHEIYVEWAYKY